MLAIKSIVNFAYPPRRLTYESAACGPQTPCDGQDRPARQQAAADHLVLGRLSDGHALTASQHCNCRTSMALARTAHVDVVCLAASGRGQPATRAAERHRRDRRNDHSLRTKADPLVGPGAG